MNNICLTQQSLSVNDDTLALIVDLIQHLAVRPCRQQYLSPSLFKYLLQGFTEVVFGEEYFPRGRTDANELV